MLKKLVLATAAVGLLMSTASAEFWHRPKKKAEPRDGQVLETKPTSAATSIQVSPVSFKTQSDAETQIKTVCVEK